MTAHRRPRGALEAAVLEQLWAKPAGLTSRQVLERLDGDLAYTTVMTILNRLWAKGLLTRERHGRACRYSPLLSESELVALRMAEALQVAHDRRASLSRFVEDLSDADEIVLRDLLDRGHDG